MAFTKITDADLNSRGATTLPNQPTISATALKQEFDAPAKNVVAPKVNNLIDELQATTSAASLGALAPSGRTGNTVQAVLNSISSGVDGKSTITLSNVATSGVRIATVVIDGASTDLKAPQGGQGTMDYGDLTNKPSINSTTLSGNKTSSDLGLAAASHTHTKSDITDFPAIPTVTDTYSGTSSDAMSGKAVKSAIDALDGTITGSPSTSKTLSAFSQTDGKVSATFSDISITKSQVSDLASETAASGGTTTSLVTTGEKFNWNEKTKVAWSQDITTGQKIATITIDGTDTDVYAPTSGGGGGGGAVDSVNGQTGTVTLNLSNINDVTISSASNGQAVVYDSSTSKWKNQTLSIPTVTDTYSGTSSDAMSGKAVKAALETLDGVITGSAGSGKTLTSFSETDGKVSATFADISITKSQVSDFPAIPTVTDTYSGTSSDAMSGKAVKAALQTLDSSITGSPATSKTLSAFSETDGIVSATFSDISIGASQVSDFAISSPTNDQVLTYDSTAGKWKNKAASGGNMVANNTVITGITTAAADNTDTDYVSAYGIGNWSNTMTQRFIFEDISSGDNGIGTWYSGDMSSITSSDESDWWQNDAFKGVLSDDNFDISIKFDPSAADEEVLVCTGYILDDTTGKICIRFDKAVTKSTHRVAVDITRTRTNVSIDTP